MTDDEDSNEFDPEQIGRELEQETRNIEESQPRVMRHEDFVYVASEDLFWHVESLVSYPARGVDARVVPWRVEQRVQANGQIREVAIPPSQDIRHDPAKTVDAVTWYPSSDRVISGMAITRNGEIRHIPDYRLLNLYMIPPPHHGDPALAAPWLDLGARLIPHEPLRRRIIQHFAYKLRYPEKKINGGIIIGGNHRVGKDMWIEAFAQALGRGNTSTIDPEEIFDKFNPWAQAVLIRVNEMEPSGSEHKAWSLIKKLKPYCAAPPVALAISEKNMKRYGIPNVALVLGMTNGLKTLYMEPDMGRWTVVDAYHLKSLWFRESDPEYFTRYKDWLDNGGPDHVAAYLETVDLSDFNPGDPVFETQALRDLIEMSNSAPDDNFGKIVESEEDPACILSAEMLDLCDSDERSKIELENLFKSRAIVHRAEKSGYRVVKKPRTEAQKEGKENPRWAFKTPTGSVLKSSMAFVKNSVSKDDEFEVIKERGRKWVERRMGRVTETPATGNPPGKVVPLRPEKL